MMHCFYPLGASLTITYMYYIIYFFQIKFYNLDSANQIKLHEKIHKYTKLHHVKINLETASMLNFGQIVTVFFSS